MTSVWYIAGSKFKNLYLINNCIYLYQVVYMKYMFSIFYNIYDVIVIIITIVGASELEGAAECNSMENGHKEIWLNDVMSRSTMLNVQSNNI